jgi:hypothetical protein
VAGRGGGGDGGAVVARVGEPGWRHKAAGLVFAVLQCVVVAVEIDVCWADPVGAEMYVEVGKTKGGLALCAASVAVP